MLAIGIVFFILLIYAEALILKTNHYQRNWHQKSKLECEKMIWSVKDDEWLIDANSIDYIDSSSIETNDSARDDVRFGTFDFLRKEIGLNISREMSTRLIVPHHLTTASDVFCNREVNMQQIKAIGFDMVEFIEFEIISCLNKVINLLRIGL